MKQLSQARTKLLIAHPYYGNVAMRLPFIDVTESRPDIWAAATDGTCIMYNKPFILRQTPAQLVGLIAHEVEHVCYLHPLRMMQRDGRRWNIACDKAINPHLWAAGMELPTEQGGGLGVIGETRMAEKIYLEDEDEGKDEDGGGWGAVLAPTDADGKELSGQAKETLEVETKQMLAEVAECCKRAGNLPEHLRDWTEQIVKAVFPWKEMLTNIMTRVVKDDYSWRKINQVHAQRGILLPGLFSEKCGVIVLFLDSSGSVSNRNMNQGFAETRDIAYSMQPEAFYVGQCDYNMGPVLEIFPGDNVDIQRNQCGGTSFIPPFEWVEEQGIQPEVFIYITDGEGSAPIEEPPYPVIWVSTKVFPAPWGERIKLEDFA